MGFPQLKFSLTLDKRTAGRFERAMGRGHKGAVRRVMQDVGRDAIKLLKRWTALDDKIYKGRFYRGWTKRHRNWRNVVVYNRVRHAKYIEHGRRAGAKMPPLKAIRPWVMAKIGDPRAVWPIAKKIAEEGIRPVPFTTSPTFKAHMRRRLKHAMQKEMQRVIKKSRPR